MVRCFEECGHLSGQKLADARDMAAKVAAARRHLYIVARTNALEREGIDGAVARAKLSVEADADAIFPKALGDADSLARFSAEVKVPLLARRWMPRSASRWCRRGHPTPEPARL